MKEGPVKKLILVAAVVAAFAFPAGAFAGTFTGVVVGKSGANIAVASKSGTVRTVHTSAHPRIGARVRVNGAEPSGRDGKEAAEAVPGAVYVSRMRRSTAGKSGSRQHEGYLLRGGGRELQETTKRCRMVRGAGVGPNIESRDEISPPQQLPPQS